MNSPSPALWSGVATRRRWWRALGWVLCPSALAVAGLGAWLWVDRIQLHRDAQADIWQGTGGNTPQRWAGIRHRFRRGVFMHDDMGSAGLLGDTEAIELIMKKLPAVGQVNGCLGNVGPPHAAEKLRALTAHDAGDTAEGWHAWWREHEGKSQATLIRESFKPLGIDPQKPPTKEQTLSLLRLIGLPSLLGSTGFDGKGAPRPSQAHTFNALRILRDHDVESEVVRREDLMGPDGDAIFHGLTAYIDFRARYPVANGVGVVFGRNAGDVHLDYRDDPDFMGASGFLGGSPWAPWAWWGGVSLLAAGGVGGAWRLWRSGRNSDNFCKIEAHS